MALLTTTQAALQLSLSPATVRKMFDNGTIRGKWIGTRRMIPEEALTELIPLAEIDEDRAVLAATTTALEPLAKEIDTLQRYVIDLQGQFNGFRGFPGVDRINAPVTRTISNAFNGLKTHVTNEARHAGELSGQITKLSGEIGSLSIMVAELQAQVKGLQAASLPTRQPQKPYETEAQKRQRQFDVGVARQHARQR